MRRIASLMIMVLMLLSIMAGVYAAQENQKWGFKMNINLKDELQPYLKVITDELVYQFNKENSTYQINSYNSAINGEFKLAYAMMRTDNGIKYDSGEYTNANLSFYANGTFPYVPYAYQWVNGTPGKKNMNISSEINILSKHISNGTITESSPGNISKISSYSSTYVKMHIKGKNLPIPVILYLLPQEKAMEVHTLEVSIDLHYEGPFGNSSAICLLAEVNEKYDNMPISSTIKISDIWTNDHNITLSVNDTNHDGYFDTGDMLCLHASPSYFQQLIESFQPINLKMKLSYSGENFTMTVPVTHYFGGNWGTSYGFSTDIMKVKPQWRNILNETKTFPTYDNFDFTIELKYNEHSVTTYTPAISITPSKQGNITMHTYGTYSGTINIIGLQEKYKKILEAVLNTTFPINLQNLNTHIPGYSNGTINETTIVSMRSFKLTGTMQYGGENVDIIAFHMPGMGSETNSLASYFKFEYFYSPTKHFIVGGSIQIGPKKFDTQATSYEDAENEIDSIKSVESNTGGSGTPTALGGNTMWLIVGAIVFIVIVVAAAVLLKRK